MMKSLVMTQQEKRDTKMILVIGAALGLLAQPILANNIPSPYLDFGTQAGVFFLLIIVSLLALTIARVIEYALSGFYQFAQFAAVGTLNSFIDIGVLNLETFLYGTSAIGLGLFACFKAISFLCSTTNSFFWNKSWTFAAHKKDNVKEVASFYIIAGLGWVLNIGVATLVKALGPAISTPGVALWTNIYAPLAGIAASFLWNFLGYKYFVFRK